MARRLRLPSLGRFMREQAAQAEKKREDEFQLRMAKDRQLGPFGRRNLDPDVLASDTPEALRKVAEDTKAREGIMTGTEHREARAKAEEDGTAPVSKSRRRRKTVMGGPAAQSKSVLGSTGGGVPGSKQKLGV